MFFKSSISLYIFCLVSINYWKCNVEIYNSICLIFHFLFNVVNFASGIWCLSLVYISKYFIFLMCYECSSLSMVTFLVSKFVLYDIIEAGYCSYECMAYLFPVVNNTPASAGDARNAGSIPGWGRSSGVGNGNPLQYPCLENTMNREAWKATVHGLAKSWT